MKTIDPITFCLRGLLALLCSVLFGIPLYSQEDTLSKISLLNYDYLPRSRVMIVGTFHFDQESHYDELSAKNQMEIQKLASALAAFKPTKVVVEKEPRHSNLLNQRYQQYLMGALSMDTLANEVYQLGFRIAGMMGHDSLYLFDDKTPFIGSLEGFSFEGFNEYAERADRGFYDVYKEDIINVYTQNQKQLNHLSLYEHLMWLNSPAASATNAQRMHLYELRVGIQKSWMGPDWLGRWYRRNIRMMANVVKFHTPPDDRILIIVGDNHKWILEQLFEFSPEFEVISSFVYLQAGLPK